ncbi:response regulator transcription factor [Mucilaginibacter sp.]|uniref:response regulator transcription factor n=1 Tax=Mucilaginibacter sp. TaxID=1882438 RepID=UPI0025E678FF|nr:response regulator transcription factor [Mucilaginibacter sp.]
MEGAAIIRVFIVDDHQVVIDSLRLLLGEIPGFLIAGETTQPLLAIQMLESTPADILITDVSMPRMNGIELARAIKQKFPAIRVLALSMFSDNHVVTEMIDAGASGYLLKNSGRREMAEALTQIAKGGLYFSSGVSALPESPFKSNQGAIKFTERELEVMKLLEKEIPDKEIAAILNLAERTVEIHRKNILNKTNAKNNPNVF